MPWGCRGVEKAVPKMIEEYSRTTRESKSNI